MMQFTFILFCLILVPWEVGEISHSTVVDYWRDAHLAEPFKDAAEPKILGKFHDVVPAEKNDESEYARYAYLPEPTRVGCQ